MKKLLIICLMVCCFSPIYAQKGKVIKGALSGRAALTDAVTRQVAKQTVKIPGVRPGSSLPSYQLVPLKIAETKTAIPTVLAVPQGFARPEMAVGTLLRNTYLQYQAADAALDRYVAQIIPENPEILYRGMHVADLGDLAPLFNGLQVDKTGYNSIYMTSNHAVARHYAKLEEGIPVVVSMDKNRMSRSSLRPGNIGNFYAEKDVPVEAIKDIFVLLDVNGTPAWHRVTLQDKLIFMPLADDIIKPASQTPYIQIINMPGEPTVKLGGETNETSAVLTARILPGSDAYNFFLPADPSGKYTGEYFMPQDMSGNQKAFYRGMRIGKIEDLKNLLINGLETHRTNYHGEIYASLMPSLPLFYATMGMELNLQVLIKIPATESLRSYTPEAFPTEDRYAPRAFQTGEQAVFRRDVPAKFISDVWVFLEVNGKPDWYKATLKNDELVFIPAFGKMITYGK